MALAAEQLLTLHLWEFNSLAGHCRFQIISLAWARLASSDVSKTKRHRSVLGPLGSAECQMHA